MERIVEILAQNVVDVAIRVSKTVRTLTLVLEFPALATNLDSMTRYRDNH